MRRRDEVPVYDEVFARFWQRYELAIEAADWPADLPPGIGPMERQRVREVGTSDEAEADAMVAGALAEGDGTEAEHSDAATTRRPRKPGATSSDCSTSPSGA